MFWIIFAFIVSSKCLVLAIYSWRNRAVPTATIFVPFSLLLALWAGAYGMELLAQDLTAKVGWAKLQYVSITFAPVFWLALMLSYAYRTRWLGARTLAALSVIPTVTLLIVWTNERHGLLWRDVELMAWGGMTLLEARYGPWFWVHTVYSYALLLGGAGLLVWMALGSLYLHRKQSVSLLVGITLPLLFNAVYLFFPDLPIDLTPYAFGFGMLAVALGFFFFYIPDPLPDARAIVIENMADSVVVLDARQRVVDLNRAAQSLLGAPAEVMSQHLAQLLPGWSGLTDWLGRAPDTPKELSVQPGLDEEPKHYRLRVSPVHEPRGDFSGQVLVIEDVTEERARQRMVEHMAYSDALTGLVNRRGLLEQSEALFEQARVNEQSTTLFYLDLNRFKNVNDILGHAAGDQLLVQAAHRLARVAQPSDLLARLGGDEFALVALGLSEEEALGRVAHIHAELQRPFTLQGHTFHVDASVGVAVRPGHGEAVSVNDLLQRADIAMYAVKEGRATSPFYSNLQGERRRALLSLETQLRRALREARFNLCYQPISSLTTGQRVGAEALLRWQENGAEVATPGTFIPFAEELGLIRDIDAWVLAQVLEQNRAYAVDAFVSVNISPRSFRSSAFSAQMSALLSASEGAEHTVVIEITESAFMDPTTSLGTLRDLKAMGLRVAVDDFGTGYSSLSYLEQLPVDILKIDKRFVRGIEQSRAKEAIIRTIITLARNLGITVLAEGVETETQRAWLEAEGCDLAQGYLLGRPQPLERLEHNAYT